MEEAESLIKEYQIGSLNGIHEFSDLIQETKKFKMYQLHNLTKLDDAAPRLGETKKDDMEYY